MEQTAEGRQVLGQWHLIKLRVIREAGGDPTGYVMNARWAEVTWQQIGDALGIPTAGASAAARPERG